MALSPNWRTAHKRYSFWALGAATLLQAVWSVAPAWTPPWLIITVNGVIGGLGLIGTYLAQPSVNGDATSQ